MRISPRHFVAAAFFIALLAVSGMFAVRYRNQIYPRFLSLTGNKAESNDKPAKSHFENRLLEVFERLEVKPEEITYRFFLEDSVKQYEVAIPQGRPIEWIVWDISSAASSTIYETEDAVHNSRRETCVLSFISTKPGQPAIRVLLSRSGRFFSTTARMAIIIDGFDFQADRTTMDILSFEAPLSISLDPAVKKSAWAAQAAGQYNKEILIQLPLEPLVRTVSQTSSFMIMVHYPENRIKSIISEAAGNIPNFSGFINVLGSRAMEDNRVMEIVLRDINRRHGYFVESKSARSSVTSSIAGRLRMPYAETGAWVRSGQTSREIEEHLRHLCVVAQKRSSIIVAAAAGPELVEALKSVLPVFNQNGVRLVYISEIVKHPR